MAQFTPHLMMAATGRRHDPMAAKVSLTLGFALWFYTLALPPILPPEWRFALAQGLADPLRLLGLGHASPLVHGVAWSLGVNLASYMLVAARKVQGAPLPALMRWQTQVSKSASCAIWWPALWGRRKPPPNSPIRCAAPPSTIARPSVRAS
jgi:hypothetical protein